MQALVPPGWEAFREVRQGSVFLTRLDTELIARLMARLAAAGKTTGGDEDFMAVQDPTWVDMARNRERDECREKLVRLGILKV